MDNKDLNSGLANISGVLVIDKPTGLTSHDVVQIVRKGTNLRRAGHTGTLDPRASGVLVVLLGPAVRLSEYISASDKRYQAIIKLGSNTETYDAEGVEVVPENVVDPYTITEEKFNEVLQTFVGDIEQVPPPFSAIKVRGKPDLARSGEEVELAPRLIHVYSLELLEWSPPEAVIDVYCSSGTYVRSLAYDLGQRLGTGAYLSGLRRTKSGQFTLRDAVQLRKLRDAFDAGNWYQYLIPAAEALGEWPAIELTAEELDAVKHGHRISREGMSGSLARGISNQGELVALLEYVEDTGEWQPKKVFYS